MGVILTTYYPPVNKHSNGISPFLIGNTSSNGGFSIAMLDYRRVTGMILQVWVPAPLWHVGFATSWGPFGWVLGVTDRERVARKTRKTRVSKSTGLHRKYMKMQALVFFFWKYIKIQGMKSSSLKLIDFFQLSNWLNFPCFSLFPT